MFISWFKVWLLTKDEIAALRLLLEQQALFQSLAVHGKKMDKLWRYR